MDSLLRYSVIISDADIDRKAFGEQWLKNALELTCSNKKIKDYTRKEIQKDNNTWRVVFTLKKGRRRK